MTCPQVRASRPTWRRAGFRTQPSSDVRWASASESKNTVPAPTRVCRAAGVDASLVLSYATTNGRKVLQARSASPSRPPAAQETDTVAIALDERGGSVPSAAAPAETRSSM